MLTKIFRTSAFRLTLIYAGIFCASFVALFAIIYWSTTTYMGKQLDDTVSNEIAEIQSDAARGGVSIETVITELARSSPGFFYLLQDRTGHVLTGNLPAMKPVMGVTERKRP